MDSQYKVHEIIALFQSNEHPLSAKLQEMLNEHYTHQTERRGCGYTQATRVIAEYVNIPREALAFEDLKIFEHYDVKNLKNITAMAHLQELQLTGWRHLDRNANVNAYLARNKTDSLSEALHEESDFQAQLRQIAAQATLEESKMICELIEDIILPKTAEHTGLTELNTLTEKPKVGSCPMAEKFFLKVAHHQLLRQGIINIFVDEQGQPVMVEKLNMGDDHSCISLKPLIMNGVRLPAGSLFAVAYDEEAVHKTANKKYKGHIIPIQDVGFWFLRITTLAISPKNRARAFTTHFKQQIQNGLLNPEITELSQLVDVAKQQI